jgi:glutathione peroxidase
MVKNLKLYFKLKRFLIVLLLLIIAFFTYVEIANRNSINMTYRQKLLKAIYPAWMWWAKLTGTNTKALSNEKAAPSVSFYTLKDTLIDGTPFSFEALKGKKVMLVNTASNCGYTDQYEDLQKLYEANKDKLVIIGFPANDFKEQEKGDDKSIAEFCKKNYGVTFTLMSKSSVIKSAHQNKVFKWLTDAALNGWNNQPPTWNFCKYIVDEEGRLINYFGATVEPFNKDIINALTH